MLTQKMMFLHPKLMRVLTDFANIDQVFHCAFLKVDTERIQQKVSQCFLEICKKLDFGKKSREGGPPLLSAFCPKQSAK